MARNSFSIKAFEELNTAAKEAMIDKIQNSVIEYMKAKKVKTWAEREVSREMAISINLVFHATSVRSFRNKVDALKHKGEL